MWLSKRIFLGRITSIFFLWKHHSSLVLNRLKNLVPYSTFKSLYFTLVQSNFYYAELVYLDTFGSNHILLQKMHNGAAHVLRSFLTSPSLLPNKHIRESLYNIVDSFLVSFSVSFYETVELYINIIYKMNLCSLYPKMPVSTRSGSRQLIPWQNMRHQDLQCSVWFLWFWFLWLGRNFLYLYV